LRRKIMEEIFLPSKVFGKAFFFLRF